MENNKDQLNPQESILAKRADSKDKSWLDYALRYEQNTPIRLEEASKFLSGIITAFISFSKIDITECNKLYVYSEFFLICLSIFFAIIVFIPFPIKYNRNVVKSIESAHTILVKRKYYSLISSLLLFVFSLIFFFIAKGI